MEDEYILPVKCLTEGLRRKDLPPIPQLAIPTRVLNECCDWGLLRKSPYMPETGDLNIIAFNCILRCGKYTAPKYVLQIYGTLKRAMRTKQFMVRDLGFWKGSCQLPRNSPLFLFLQADSVTLKVTNQKNSRISQTIHHDYFASDLYPCKTLARWIHKILRNSVDTESYICEYILTDKTPFATVTPTVLITSIRLSLATLKIHQTRINPDLLGVHYL